MPTKVSGGGMVVTSVDGRMRIFGYVKKNVSGYVKKKIQKFKKLLVIWTAEIKS